MEISALDLLNLIKTQKVNLIDVRSEGEFLKGSIPGAINSPILNDDHRHQVGLCYKLFGQDKAIECGHRLVDPIKAQLLEEWSRIAESGPVYVHCWRGGLRSNFAAEWMREIGIEAITVSKGYKEIRALLVSKLNPVLNSVLDINPNSNQEPNFVSESRTHFFILAGLTGTGKTKLLNSLPKKNQIDLEHLANHRGSAFGSNSSSDDSSTYNTQPTQQNFENALGLELYFHPDPFVIEDESRSIGKLQLTKEFYELMQTQPIILQEVSLEDRVLNILNEYILDSKKESQALNADLLNSLTRIQKRLGGSMFKSISEIMKEAFEQKSNDRHRDWISMLLKSYYDLFYQSRLDKSKDQIIFSGSTKEVYEFIIDRTGRGRTR